MGYTYDITLGRSAKDRKVPRKVDTRLSSTGDTTSKVQQQNAYVDQVLFDRAILVD
jgi:hypothetical protein